MVQVNGTRGEVQRFNSERAGSVKYSTKCPWRSDSPCAASLAIPTSGCLLDSPTCAPSALDGVSGSLSSIWRRDGCMEGPFCIRFLFAIKDTGDCPECQGRPREGERVESNGAVN